MAQLIEECKFICQQNSEKEAEKERQPELNQEMTSSMCVSVCQWLNNGRPDWLTDTETPLYSMWPWLSLSLSSAEKPHYSSLLSSTARVYMRGDKRGMRREEMRGTDWGGCFNGFHCCLEHFTRETQVGCAAVHNTLVIIVLRRYTKHRTKFNKSAQIICTFYRPLWAPTCEKS